MTNSIPTKVAVLEERLEQEKESKILQAKEYERRLDALNHANEKMTKLEETFMTKDAYELRHRILEIKIEALQKLAFIGLGGVYVLVFILKFLTK